MANNQPMTKGERHEKRKDRIRKIFEGKATLADFGAADIKKLTVILALAYIDDTQDVKPEFSPE